MPKDKEEEKLREEALVEWVSRGRKAQDFRMDKMYKIWKEEDGDDDDDDDDEDLADKQELMNSYDVLGPLVDHAKDVALQYTKRMILEGKQTLQTAWKYAELPVLRDRRLLRQHVVHVHEMDLQAYKYSNLHQRLVDEHNEARRMEGQLQFSRIKRNKRQAFLLDRLQQVKAEADRVERARRLEESNKRRQERLEKAVQEKQRQVDEKKEKAEQALVQRRQRNVNYWQKQLVEAREFAEYHANEMQQKKELDRKASELKEESYTVEKEESEDAVQSRQTLSSIGIFDTTDELRERDAAAADRGHRTKLDERIVGISTTPAFVIENEQKRIELLEAQSKVAMLCEKLEQVDEAQRNLKTDMSTILERKEQIQREIRQTQIDEDELKELLAGPPRRDPSEHEKQHLYALVTRRAVYVKQLGDVDARVANTQKRTAIVDRSKTSFLRILCDAQEKLSELQAQVDAMEKERHELPAVVGKALFQPQQMVMHPKDFVDEVDEIPSQVIDPVKAFNQVTMESKFELLKSSVEPVNEHYKKAKRQAIETWKVDELRFLAKQELNSVKTRLVKAHDRYVDFQSNSLRSDIVEAIRKYHEDGNKLRQCIFPLKGLLEWWHHRVPKKSMGLTYCVEQNALMLDKEATSGTITGSFQLPKRCSYRIFMNVSIQSTILDKADVENSSQDATTIEEDWNLYIGPDMDSLRHHIFRDLSGKIVKAGDVSFDFSGIRLCFMLKISARGSIDRQRTICRYVFDNAVRFEERLDDFREEEQRMRLYQKESHFVSEMVKTMRLQSTTTCSQRTMELLEELIQVEESKAKMWDSTLFHGHSQRFKRAEYVTVLRGEIKKQIAAQIDSSIALRQGRAHVDARVITDASLNEKQSENSRMDFLARKAALMEPKRLAGQRSLGDYCSLKSRSGVNGAAASFHVDLYRNKTMIIGVRYEWRQARTKLHVMHKLYGPSSHKDKADHMTAEWFQLESANAVVLASSCVEVLRERRKEEAEARVLVVAKSAKIEQLQQETQHKIQEVNTFAIQEAKDDELLAEQMKRELARREKTFYADAVRLTTYNGAISSQIDSQVQHQLHVRAQELDPLAIEPIVLEVKENFARQYVQGKLALVRKTWDRKLERVRTKRIKARKEREFRILHEDELLKEVRECNERELALLKSIQEERARQDFLRIPNFQLAIEQTFACEHVELKAWGTKYALGLKCKQCGKEMSKSYDDQDHTRGGNRELDEDVKRHRAQTTSGVGFRFKDAKHLERVEKERLRLEKEARSMEEVESMLYDRLDPKSIDDFNYRHAINRKTLLDNADSSDPLYPRLIQDLHRASYQDELLFHGRLRNYNFRIQQIFHQHAACSDQLVIQRSFLQTVRHENDTVVKNLELIEADYTRALALCEEDQAAQKSFKKAKIQLLAAQQEREAAHYAIVGVEEEAEFAELHAPALVKSSDEMNAMYQRLREEYEAVSREIASAKERLDMAEMERNRVKPMMNKLLCRTPHALLRTRYGLVKVKYFRSEDNCVIVTPLHWNATMFLPMDEVLAYEAAFREEEKFAMADEDEQGHAFVRLERKMEREERRQMAIEEHQIREIMAWRTKKEEEEKILTKTMCRDELEAQLVYEMEGRKKSLELAHNEAKILQRRGRVYPSRKRRALPQGPSRFDVMRVARASEKRLAMAMIEQHLLGKEQQLREERKVERNASRVTSLSEEVYGELLEDTIQTLCEEQIREEVYEAQELIRSKGIAAVVTTAQAKTWSNLSVKSLLGLDRLWIARKEKYSLLYATWRKEFAKLRLVQAEMTRRKEIQRRADAHRRTLETRRKEMLAEERHCRQFYLEEAVLCMQERKAMARAEMETQEYLRQVETEALKAKYSEMIDDRNRINDKAARRLEIKTGKNEQHRVHREWRQMKIEDELSMEMRDTQRAHALEVQFDEYFAKHLIHGKGTSEMEAARLAARLREAEQVAVEKQKAFDKQMVQEHISATVETFYALSRAEMEWMEAVERAAFWQQRAPLLEANLKRMQPEVDRVLEERAHVVYEAQSKREDANKCRQRIEAANVSLSRARRAEEKATMQYKRVHKLNATMDSQVLHGRVQRFRTVYLRARLYGEYFALLTDSIVRRALVECSEREVARLETQREQFEQERAFKSKEVHVLQRKRRRTLRLRLRRAELGKLMFGDSQRCLLKEMLQRWMKLCAERTRVRASFKLKHELLLHKERLTTTTSSPILTKESLVRERKSRILPTKLSIMHDYQGRLLQCRLCRQEYSEAQNHCYACVYHPSTYEVACIRTCETRRGGASRPVAVPASCMLHRTKRWLCCDETEEGRYGSTGCARRFHLPVRNHGEIANVVATSQDERSLAQMKHQMLELRERNVVKRLKFATRPTVNTMAQNVAKQRATAAKWPYP